MVEGGPLEGCSNSNSSPSNLTSATSQLVRGAAWHQVMELTFAPDYLAVESRDIRMRSAICLPTGLGRCMCPKWPCGAAPLLWVHPAAALAPPLCAKSWGSAPATEWLELYEARLCYRWPRAWSWGAYGSVIAGFGTDRAPSRPSLKGLRQTLGGLAHTQRVMSSWPR